MKKIHYILFLATAFSCIAEFQPKWDGLKGEEKYTVHSILFADSVAKVYLGKTSRINEDIDPAGIAQAEVILSWSEDRAGNENSQSEKLAFRDSVFVGSHTLLPGLYYKLEITTADGQQLSSSTTIPEHVQIESSSLLFPAGYMDTPTIKGPFSRIQLGFMPPGSQTAYFEVYTSVKDNLSEVPKYNIMRGVNNDQLILSEDLPSDYLYSFVFSTNGNQKEQVQLSFDHFANPFSSEFYPTLLHVSEEYFLYKKSLFDHLDAIYYEDYFEPEDLYLPNIFKSVPRIHSNIAGGVGIFAGVNRSERKTICNLVGTTCE